MRTAIRRKKLLAIALTLVALCTFGLFTTAFAAAPNRHAARHGTAPQAAQEHGAQSSHASGLHGLQNAMQRVQRNVNRQVSHLQEVMGRAPDQAKSALQSTVQRMQDRLQTLLDNLGNRSNNLDQTAQSST